MTAGYGFRAGRHFRRPEPRRRARAFVLGLLAPLPRKNCWTIAEQPGDGTPDGMQHLPARACWDADGVRDEVPRASVAMIVVRGGVEPPTFR